MPLQIGQLRHQISLQSPTNSQNEYGEQTQSFDTYATIWAFIEPLSGRELLHAQQISEEIDSRITIRYNSSVISEHRILFGTRIFEIKTIINPEERNEYQQLYCKEIK